MIAGTGIVLGGNSSKLKTLQENLASFEMMTEWVDASDLPSAHAFVTTPPMAKIIESGSWKEYRHG